MERPKALVATTFVNAVDSPFSFLRPVSHTASQYLRVPKTSRGTCKDKDKRDTRDLDVMKGEIWRIAHLLDGGRQQWGPDWQGSTFEVI